jgi:cellulose synthase/poly-beta-1,6-N-acetylglucosamine synthase-like glycosyltransferase
LKSYDKVSVAAFFVVISISSFVLVSTLRMVVFSNNILVDTDIDLTIPTLIPLGLNLMYLCLSTFVIVYYLVKYDSVKDQHVRMVAKKARSNINYYSSAVMANRAPFYSSRDLCSIIIPACNEETVIRKAVLGCLQQTYNNIEVVVVCHNSSDRTFDEAQVKDRRVKVFDLRTEEAGKPIALNYGLEHSSGRYIMVMDADHEFNKEFIEYALVGFDQPYAAVQGRCNAINRNYNFLTKMLSIEDDLWSSPYMTVRTLIGKRCPLLGSGFIIKKDVLLEVGGFGGSLVEDYDLSFRLYRKKYRILFVPLCICYHEHPPTLQLMIRQRARWTKGFIDLLNKRITEPTDILGHINWIYPIVALSGAMMLAMISYVSIFNLIFGYLPFAFSYLPLQAWFLITGLNLVLHVLVLLKKHGWLGFKYVLYLIPYTVFSQYGIVVLFRAFFVRSWASTKTSHGFVANMPEIASVRIERND